MSIGSILVPEALVFGSDDFVADIGGSKIDISFMDAALGNINPLTMGGFAMVLALSEFGKFYGFPTQAVIRSKFADEMFKNRIINF